MRKTAIVSSALLMLTGIAVVSAQEAAPQGQATIEKAVKIQTVCPVMGDPIDKKLYVDYEGKRVYVCCKICIKKVQKDPAKYIKMLEDQGITLEKAGTAETSQPTSGEPRNHPR